MRRVLVTARAMTAVSVARAAHRAGLVPVGVLTAADRDATWTRALADLVEVPAYDDVAALVEAATRLGAQMIHPGVGFAAEDPALDRVAAQAGVVVVGPGASALEELADKLALARRLERLGIKAPWSRGPLRGPEQLAGAGREHGWPLVLKTVRGGGGRGVVRVDDESQVAPAWQACAGLGPLLTQESLEQVRHVEVQALGDGTGAVALLGTRECSVQRRFQKLLEEAPAPFLSPEQVAHMESATRRLLGSVAYRGAGTCEFLVGVAPGSQPLLLEVNARLQVEHAVTEEVTGVDLVLAQLLVAQGVGLEQALAEAAVDGRQVGVGADLVVEARGHAVEARLYAEDERLMPDTTMLEILDLPAPTSTGAGAPPRLRVERGTFPGDSRSNSYSEPLALVTATAPTRPGALDALAQALGGATVTGPKTLAPLLHEVVTSPEMARPGQVTTTWFEQRLAAPRPTPGTSATSSACVADAPQDAGGGLAAQAELSSPLAGVLVLAPAPGARVRAGEQVAVVEAMKMRVPVTAPAPGVVLVPGQAPQAGEAVAAGQVLGLLSPQAPEAGPSLPCASAAGAARRRAARERALALVDPGSLREVVDDDAVLTARARVGGQEVSLWVQDPTVLGGTIGLAGSRRVAELIDAAASAEPARPVISVLDGGGARVQQGVDALAGAGLVLAAETRARGRALQVGLVLGSAAGGAAYAPALADLLVMVEGAGRVFLTGPAVLRTATGEQVSPEALGGAQVHKAQAGTTHLTAPDETSAFALVRRLLSFAPTSREGGPALRLLPGGLGVVARSQDRATAEVVPADPAEVYDVRSLLRRLADRGEVLELREHWAASVVTALCRVDGVPVGVVATQPLVLAGALTPKASQKVTEHLGLCAALGLGVLTVVDTPGFLPGAALEAAGTVRHGAHLVRAYASYPHPLLTLVTRRAYGGAYVALGSKALSGARVLAWGSARIGVMDAASAVGLTHRRDLDQAQSQGGSQARAALAERLRQDQERLERPQEAARLGWVDEVITASQTRARVAAWLWESFGARVRAHTGSEPRHVGDGWVSCGCGKRHWGLLGAAGVLVWRFPQPVEVSQPAEADKTDEAAQAGGRGVEVLVQLRARWTHHGGTWGLPGGALAQGEDAQAAALRECQEETGLPAHLLRPGASHVQRHPHWSYTTVSAQAPGDRRWNVLLPQDAESEALVWVRLRPNGQGSWHPPAPPGADALLPALAHVWHELAGLLPRPGEGA